MVSLLNSYKHFKKLITTVLHNLFQNTEEEGLLPNSFDETSITMIPNETESTRKET